MVAGTSGPQTKPDAIWSLPEMDEFAQLTYLLRLIVVLRHKNGKAPVHQFVDHAPAAPRTADHCIHTRSLDAISAVLVQNTEVIAASYHTENPTNWGVIAVSNHALEGMDGRESDDKVLKIPQDTEEDCDGSDLRFPTAMVAPLGSRSLRIAAVPNSDATNGGGSEAPGDHNPHNLRILPPGINHWPGVKEDPVGYFATMR